MKSVGFCWALLAVFACFVVVTSASFIGMLGVLPIAVVAALALLVPGRWAGAIVVLGGAGLSLLAVYMLVLVVGAAHGGGEASVVLSIAGVLGALGISSIIVGISRFAALRKEAPTIREAS